MAGLLDFIQSPAGVGLLSAVAGGMAGARRNTPWNNAGRAGLAGLTGYAQANDQIRQDKEKQLADQYRQMQMDEITRKRADRDAYRAQFKPAGQTDFQADNPFGEDLGTLKTETPPMFAGQAIDPKLAAIAPFLDPKEMYSAITPKQAKYGDVKFSGDGRAYMQGDDGSIKWVDDVTPRDKLVADNLGGKQVYRTEYSADPVAEVERTATPDSVLTDQRTRQEGALNRGVTVRGQNMADARSRVSEAKAPTGYRFTADGGLEPIPGGPADIKAGEAGAKDAARKEFALAQSQNVLDAITDAKKLVGPTTAGFGGTLRNLPMSGARDLDAKITTIKANLGFDRLQQMRDTSPTGGALGQVAVQELTALQATVASLDQLQSPAELNKALGKIETHYRNWQNTLKGEHPSGAPSAKPAAKTQSFALPPNAKQYEGKTIKDTKTGKRFQAKGGKWVEIK